MQNCVGGAQGFFGGVMVPCMLLAGAAYGQFGTTVGNDNSLAHTTFKSLMALCLTTALMVVFIGTAMGTRLHGGGFDPMSTDALSFMIREFELPYIMCRLGFISSLLSFIGGSALRMSVTKDLPPSTVKGLTCMLLAVLFGCISLFNATLIHYNSNVLNLMWRALELTVFNVQHYLRPLSFLALLSIRASIYFVAKGFVEGGS